MAPSKLPPGHLVLGPDARWGNLEGASGPVTPEPNNINTLKFDVGFKQNSNFPSMSNVNRPPKKDSMNYIENKTPTQACTRATDFC